MSDTIPVLFDTDIGSDIDDAVALAYLLSQPRCELLGVTTVSGDTAKRAAMIEITCRAAGRENIPVHAGLAGPLLHGPGQPRVPQFEAVAHLRHRTDYERTAVDFLRETIRSRPGEIVLLAVGPMTNLATLFALDPEIPSLLKSIVLMCGIFTTGGPGAREWNAFVDPVATALTYHGGADRLLSVGLDVTTKCTMPADECRERFTRAGGALGVVGSMAEVWFRERPRITFHDPLAAALIFEPDLCSYAAGNIDTVITPGPMEGMTRWKAEHGGKHRIAVSVDPDRFMAHYFGVTGGA